MSKQIGDQLQAATGAFTVKAAPGTRIKALNLCLAPGGYTWSLLKVNPEACIRGITLPPEIGGHPMILPYGSADLRVQVEFMDITMLAPEFGTPISEIPPQHPDALKFRANSPYQDQAFDIVLCDGQVLRTHQRAECRQKLEPIRLSTAQLIFAMKRIKKGGTFIMLLHKVDVWDNVELLRTFAAFSKIQLFKPARIHAQRSSFYLVAKDVQPDHPAVVDAVEKWKKDWWTATFAGREGTGLEKEEEDEQKINSILEDFGPELVTLGRPIWQIQLNALKKNTLHIR
jgi:23S rRNA U2552 (ribose-2'-O)-methylase RlmE/FtsJ